MECRTPRPAGARTTCVAVPGLLLGLSKLCKLTKVCAAPPSSLDCAGGGAKLSNAGGYDERLVVEILLEAVGSLKSAYVRLQRAHVPYDPARIAAAGEAVADELDSVAALQCLCSGGGVGKLVEERWSLVQELEGAARKRESDIVALRRELEGLRRASARLGEQIKTSRASVRRGEIAVVPRQLTTTTTGAVLELFMAAAAAVQGFAELIASMTPAAAASSSSSDRCAGNAEVRCRSRGRYSLEAHLWRTMLGGGGGGAGTGEEEEEEEKVFDAARFDRVMRRRDPLDALAEEERPISGGLARFCRSRYLAGVPPETERAALGNLDHRAFVSRGGHPRTWFYRAFATAARAAWALRVATATTTAERGSGGSDAARMFHARGGSRYSAAHMRSVAAAAEKLGVVAFTVAPGLSVRGAVRVACRVFLRDSDNANDVQKSVTDNGFNFDTKFS